MPAPHGWFLTGWTRLPALNSVDDILRRRITSSGSISSTSPKFWKTATAILISASILAVRRRLQMTSQHSLDKKPGRTAFKGSSNLITAGLSEKNRATLAGTGDRLLSQLGRG